MNTDFIDLLDDNYQEHLSPKSVLFYQSNRVTQRLDSGTEDEITPWSDSVGPPSLIRNVYKGKISFPSQKLQAKKRTVSAASHHRPKIRDKSGHNSTQLTTEPSKEAGGHPETLSGPYHSGISRSQASPSTENVKIVNISNTIPEGVMDENKKPGSRKYFRMVSAAKVKKMGGGGELISSEFYFSTDKVKSQKNVSTIQGVHRQLGIDSRQFWLEQARTPIPWSEELSIDDKRRQTPVRAFERTFSGIQGDITHSFVQHEGNIPGTESSRNVIMGRDLSSKKVFLDATPLRGIKTELNEFKTKLKGMGLHNFEKKCKGVLDRLYKQKGEGEYGQRESTNIKLKLQVLRKMTRENMDIAKTNQSKGVRIREKREQHIKVVVGSGNSTTHKVNTENETSLFHTEQSVEGTRDEITSCNMNVSQIFSKHFLQEGYVARSLQTQTRRSPEMFRLAPAVEMKKYSRSPERSPDEGKEMPCVRNLSCGKIAKIKGNKKFFQAYGKFEESQCRVAGEVVVKRPNRVHKGTGHESKQSPKKGNRKYSKCKLNNSDMASLKELLRYREHRE